MLKRKLRNFMGFTLGEVLITVAILIVLLAVAVPGVLGARSSLKMLELNDTAREIFLAAQNGLTGKLGAGTLKPTGVQDDAAEDCYWLSSADGSGAYLLPGGAIDPTVREGHYMIWYNEATATVLEVYYAEQALDPDAVRGHTYSGASSSEARRAEMIGYYQGEDRALQPGWVLQQPVLKLVNEDELRAEITVPDAANYVTKNVKLWVTVQQLDENGAPTGAQALFEDVEYNPVDGRATLVLDSLTGERFQEICPGLTPGANIRVTATLTADGAAQASAARTANSLFASRSGDGVKIAYSRHLQNLNADVSGVRGTIEARQIRDIQWPKGQSFQSISSSAKVAGDSYTLRSYDGAAMKIRGLWGENGLIAYGENMTISGVRLVDPLIVNTNTAGANVGVLAGTAVNTEITNCWVYADNPRGGTGLSSVGSDSSNTGGLVGYMDRGHVVDSFAALPSLAANGGNAGGLIGYLVNTGAAEYRATIQNCYSAVDRFAGKPASAGMRLGNSSGGTVKACYAVGSFTEAGAVCGFAGGDIAVQDSYCAVTYDKGEVQPAYLFAQNGDNSCVYLTTGHSGQNADKAQGMDYEALHTWNPAGDWGPVEESHPYQEALAGQSYPFPALKGYDYSGALPHYGSWPVQKVDDIALFKTADGNEKINFVLIPTGETVTFWAEGQYKGENAMEEVTMTPPNGTTFESASSSFDEQTGRTEIKLTASVDPRVTYVDLAAGDVKLRVVVVFYQAGVTLEGVNQQGDTAKGVGYSNSIGFDGGEDPAEGKLSLAAGTDKGVFTASLSWIFPKEIALQSGLNSIGANMPEGTKLSAGTADFTNWEKIKAGDPAVTENNGAVKADAGGNNNTLTVEAAEPGSATVTARWAMDESVQAICRVSTEKEKPIVSFSRVEIQKVFIGSDVWTAPGDGNEMNVEYLSSQMGDRNWIFTPKLENGGASGEIYTWTVAKNGTPVTNQGSSGNSSDSNTNGGRYTFVISVGDLRGGGDYVVTMTYTDRDSGMTSTDTFTIHVSSWF